jgi:hypothetical protein
MSIPGGASGPSALRQGWKGIWRQNAPGRGILIETGPSLFLHGNLGLING